MRPAIKADPEKIRKVIYSGSQPIRRSVWDEAMRITQQAEAMRRSQTQQQYAR